MFSASLMVSFRKVIDFLVNNDADDGRLNFRESPRSILRSCQILNRAVREGVKSRQGLRRVLFWKRLATVRSRIGDALHYWALSLAQEIVLGGVSCWLCRRRLVQTGPWPQPKRHAQPRCLASTESSLSQARSENLFALIRSFQKVKHELLEATWCSIRRIIQSYYRTIQGEGHSNRSTRKE